MVEAQYMLYDYFFSASCAGDCSFGFNRATSHCIQKGWLKKKYIYSEWKGLKHLSAYVGDMIVIGFTIPSHGVTCCVTVKLKPLPTLTSFIH